MSNEDYQKKYGGEYDHPGYQRNFVSSDSEDKSNYELDYDPEDKDNYVEEEEERRFGFELQMPVFERIICKDPETKEQGEQIDLLVLIFFIAMFSLPTLSFIQELYDKLSTFFR